MNPKITGLGGRSKSTEPLLTSEKEFFKSIKSLNRPISASMSSFLRPKKRHKMYLKENILKSCL